jgi:hypothetical protein
MFAKGVELIARLPHEDAMRAYVASGEAWSAPALSYDKTFGVTPKGVPLSDADGVRAEIAASRDAASKAIAPVLLSGLGGLQ